MYRSFICGSSSIPIRYRRRIPGCGRDSYLMVHPILGARTFPHGADLDAAIRDGWTPDYNGPANFLESVHIQAYYFQARFFPRLRWFTLHAPDGEFFVLADRAVGWAAKGYV